MAKSLIRRCSVDHRSDGRHSSAGDSAGPCLGGVKGYGGMAILKLRACIAAMALLSTAPAGACDSFRMSFDAGSASLGPPVSRGLITLFHLLQRSPDLQLRISGHDEFGGAEHNPHFAARRALTVRTWLIEHGIARSRITIVPPRHDAGSFASIEAARRARRNVVEIVYGNPSYGWCLG